MTALLDAWMMELLQQQVRVVLARLPPEVDPEAFMSGPETITDALADRRLWRALGWIEGVADSADVTVLELLDEARIALDVSGDET